MNKNIKALTIKDIEIDKLEIKKDDVILCKTAFEPSQNQLANLDSYLRSFFLKKLKFEPVIIIQSPGYDITKLSKEQALLMIAKLQNIIDA